MQDCETLNFCLAFVVLINKVQVHVDNFLPEKCDFSAKKNNLICGFKS